MFAYRSVDEGGRILQTYMENAPKDRGLPLEQQPALLLTSPSACIRLYRRELLERTGILFPPRVWYEDMRTTPKLLAEARQVVYLDYVGYNYFQPHGLHHQKPERRPEPGNRRGLRRPAALVPAAGTFREVPPGAVLTWWCTTPTSPPRCGCCSLTKSTPCWGNCGPIWSAGSQTGASAPTSPALSRAHRLLLSLLGKKRYGLVALLFQLKGRLG